ncbi:hypothetical protein KIN_40610 [Litoreibacter roseus]|uniref:Uncharacterized protein n=1 Tax=Litoreibacter roseus TaxID=2601869 RepID=A0A6N6JLZ3_9RHOB|nr:hypothetical protein KIN_40610 [Litoreibacter roseus]
MRHILWVSLKKCVLDPLPDWVEPHKDTGCFFDLVGITYESDSGWGNQERQVLSTFRCVSFDGIKERLGLGRKPGYWYA